jgi:nitroreductase
VEAAAGEAPPGPAVRLVRRAEDDLFRESVPTALATLPTDVFGRGDVAPDALEEAVRAAAAIPLMGEWSFVTLESPVARHRLLATMTERDHGLGAAPILIVPCVRVAGHRTSARGEEAILLSAGAAIRTLVVALHARLLGWWWDPAQRFDADEVRAALALKEDWRPVGIGAVGSMQEGGASRPRPPTP